MNRLKHWTLGSLAALVVVLTALLGFGDRIASWMEVKISADLEKEMRPAMLQHQWMMSAIYAIAQHDGVSLAPIPNGWERVQSQENPACPPPVREEEAFKGGGR